MTDESEARGRVKPKRSEQYRMDMDMWVLKITKMYFEVPHSSIDADAFATAYCDLNLLVNISRVLFRLLKLFIRYRGNNICKNIIRC